MRGHSATCTRVHIIKVFVSAEAPCLSESSRTVSGLVKPSLGYAAGMEFCQYKQQLFARQLRHGLNRPTSQPVSQPISEPANQLVGQPPSQLASPRIATYILFIRGRAGEGHGGLRVITPAAHQCTTPPPGPCWGLGGVGGRSCIASAPQAWSPSWGWSWRLEGRGAGGYAHLAEEHRQGQSQSKVCPKRAVTIQESAASPNSGPWHWERARRGSRALWGA